MHLNGVSFENTARETRAHFFLSVCTKRNTYGTMVIISERGKKSLQVCDVGVTHMTGEKPPKILFNERQYH